MKNHNPRIRRAVGVSVLALGLLWAGPASAAVNLRFTPGDTTVPPAAVGRLSIMIDDLDANLRTIDVFVTYDPAVVRSVGGGPGLRFVQSGFTLFQGMENNVPGQWHGYVVIMGWEDVLLGPGELFYWNFEGLTEGVTPIIAVEAYVAAGDGTYYPEVLLDGTTITVHDPLSAVGDVPLPLPELKVWPNPFNPLTTVTFYLPQAARARLAVYDLRGRELIVLADGLLPAGPARFNWNGRDRDGQAQPAGQYLFRLESDGERRTAKATLVK
jgi:hypothetical protein